MNAETGSRGALLVVLAVLLACFVPQLARGRVLFPHDNAAEVGVEPTEPDYRSRIFKDVCTLYVPEMQGQLTGDRSGWLTTWNPHNELGRPMFPAGFGAAFLVGRLVSVFTDDALRFFTWMAILSVVVTALTTFGFLGELGLHPLARAVASIGISVGPIYPAWQVIPLVQWGYGWAFAALWSIERLRRGAGWKAVLALAFSVHAVLLTGYLPHVMLLGWIVAGWVVLRLAEAAAVDRARFVRGVLAGTAWGAIASLPAYADLWIDLQRSIRAASPTGPNPTLSSTFLADVLGFHGAENLSAVSYGLSPVYAGLAITGILGAFAGRGRGRRTPRAGYWSAASLILLAASASPALDRLVQRLLLDLSNWSPVYAALLPATVLVAVGTDRLLTRVDRRRKLEALVCAASFVLAGTQLTWHAVDLDPASFAWATALALGVVLLVLAPARPLLGVLVVAAVARNGRALVEWTPRSEVHTDSPLLAEVRRLAPEGGRYAWVGPPPRGGRFLRPNVELLTGTSSVHTYDHFVSRAFDAWARRLEEPRERPAYDRFFERIDVARNLTGEDLALSGIRVVLSLRDLNEERFEERARFGDVRVFTPKVDGPLEATVDASRLERAEDGGVHLDPQDVRLGGTITRRLEDSGDRLRFATAPSTRARILFVSQQHHPSWRARSDDRPLETVVVNGMYLGVRLPPGITEVELAFEPWILHLQLFQALFLVGGLIAGAGRLRDLSSRSRSRARPR